MNTSAHEQSSYKLPKKSPLLAECFNGMMKFRATQTLSL